MRSTNNVLVVHRQSSGEEDAHDWLSLISTFAKVVNILTSGQTVLELCTNDSKMLQTLAETLARAKQTTFRNRHLQSYGQQIKVNLITDKNSGKL